MRRTVVLDRAAEEALAQLVVRGMSISEAVRYALVNAEGLQPIMDRLDRIEARLVSWGTVPPPEPPAFDVGGFLGTFDDLGSGG